MGTLYHPKYRDRHGTMQHSTIWWVRYRQHGRTVRESTETTNEKKARQFLQAREGKVALNIPVIPRAERLTVAEAVELIRQDYRANGHKSASTLEYRLAHVLRHFGPSMRLARLTTGHIEAYKTKRLTAKAAPGTINREIAALARMATLARHQYGLAVPFVVTLLEERNVRTGFFEEEAYVAVCHALRPELAALATVAKLTGWRKSELRSRRWPHVDLKAGWLRLEPEETKNREGRQFPLIPELRAVLEAQRARVDAIQRETKRVIPWVFCRDDGSPVGDFKKAWATAVIKAGYFRTIPVLDARGQPCLGPDGVPLVVKKHDKIPHDFRRTAVRNLIRAGIPETVAMKMTGHRTRNVFQRYAIVEEGMLQEAGEKLIAATMRSTTATNAAPGRVVEFRK